MHLFGRIEIELIVLPLAQLAMLTVSTCKHVADARQHHCVVRSTRNHLRVLKLNV